jgi:uncharacterized protein
MKIAIAGATGFVGKRLVETLHKNGHDLTLLVRDRSLAEKMFPQTFFPQVLVVKYEPLVLADWQKSLNGLDGVINLAGSPIAGKFWSEKVKTEIFESRQLTTRILVQAIANANPRPQVLINGSAIGFYGTDLTKEFDEYSFAGKGFLAKVCQAWEKEADSATELGLKVIKLRTGLVLGNGGILERILPIFQLGLGGRIGSGNQWFSWIDRDDLVNLIQFLLTQPQLSGIFNGTAPNPVTNADFTLALAKVLDRPAFLPVPEFVLQLVLGEASILALAGQKVLPKKVELAGFKYEYRHISACLNKIIG